MPEGWMGNLVKNPFGIAALLKWRGHLSRLPSVGGVLESPLQGIFAIIYLMLKLLVFKWKLHQRKLRKHRENCYVFNGQGIVGGVCAECYRLENQVIQDNLQRMNIAKKEGANVKG